MGLKDGNIAGFGIFQSPHTYIAVRKDGTQNYLIMVNDGLVIDSVKNFNPNKIWIKANTKFEEFTATFSYSTYGKKFIPFGNTLKMDVKFKYIGNHFALLNYSTQTEGDGGYVDFNWVHFNTKTKP